MNLQVSLIVELGFSGLRLRAGILGFSASGPGIRVAEIAEGPMFGLRTLHVDLCSGLQLDGSCMVLLMSRSCSSSERFQEPR